MTSRNVKWAQLFHILKSSTWGIWWKCHFPACDFPCLEDAQCCQDNWSFNNQKMSSNWPTRRGWLCYDARWTLIILTLSQMKKAVSSIFYKSFTCFFRRKKIHEFLERTPFSCTQHHFTQWHQSKVIFKMQSNHLVTCPWSAWLYQLLQWIMADQAQPIRLHCLGYTSMFVKMKWRLVWVCVAVLLLNSSICQQHLFLGKPPCWGIQCHIFPVYVIR